MFQSIYELPTQVRASLDEDDQKAFMDAYNEEDPKTEEEVADAMKKAWHACSRLPSSFSFKIVAAMDDVDRDREIISSESVEKALDSYIKHGGNVQWEHANYNVGTIWDWEPIKKNGMDGVLVYGNLYGGDIVYDKMRKNFIDGKNSLSVGGEADMGKYQCDSKGCYVKRNMKQLLEISLCAVPANKHCKLEWYNEKAKGKVKKSASDFRLDVVEYEIHKSYGECPIQYLKKSLSSIYPEVHATYDGVFVPMSFEDYLDEYMKITKSGLRPIWTGRGAIIQNRDIMRELAFKDGHRLGLVDDDGRLTSKVTKSDFQILHGWGIIDDTGTITKDAKWKQYGLEAKRARDEAAGPKRYLRLHTGILDPNQEHTGLDPSKVRLNNDEVHRGQPKGVPFAGAYHENQKMPTTFIRTYSTMPAYADKDWSRFKGETFALHPRARYLYINDYNQLRDLFEKYHAMKPDDDTRGAWRESSGEKPVLDYGALARDYDAIEWGPKMRHLSFMHKVKQWDDWYDPTNPEMNSAHKVPITVEENDIGNELAEKYNLPNESIDELMILNGKVKNDAGEDESIFYDVQPYDMSERRVKTTFEKKNPSAKTSVEPLMKTANWKEQNQDARDYMEGKKIKNAEFLRVTDKPMEDVSEHYKSGGGLTEEPYLNKPRNAVYGAKYTPDSSYDSDWLRFVDQAGMDWWTTDKGEIYTLHPDSRVLTIHNGDEYDEMARKYNLNLSAHPFMSNSNSPHPSYKKLAEDYDHIYFPDFGAIQSAYYDGRPVLDANQIITLNQFLPDGKTPTRVMRREYVPRQSRQAKDDRGTIGRSDEGGDLSQLDTARS